MSLALAYLEKLAFVVGGLVLLSFIGSCACWICFGDGWSDLRMAWRVRRAKKALKRARVTRKDHNPLPYALRNFSRSPVIGRDQVSASERMKLVSQR